MELQGYVRSVIDGKLMVVELEDGKQIFLPWNGANVGDPVTIEVR